MGLDIRIPIGMMFAILGLILVLSGLLTGAQGAHSLGININLWWGIVMLVFGGTMYVFGRRGSKTERDL
jgi:hypothetical protein